MVPWVMKMKKEKEKGKGKKKKVDEAEGNRAEDRNAGEIKPQDKTFLRYYHLYRKGELEHDIEQAGGELIETGYEKDNWWAIATVKGGM